ncbi:IS481 family transposase ISChy6 [Moorella humiferrea]|uniref:ExeA family protein n=1 Tax=Neomoorella humiferrea TaxID=676965 RepID=UPI0030D52674
MYQAFYGLKAAPFGKELKPQDAFPSHSLLESEARLEYLSRVRGMGLIVGEPGAGKTFALRVFCANLSPALFKVIYLPLSTGTVMDFYRGLARGLGEEPGFRKIDLFHQIQQAIQVLFRDKKITPVFILDEMHLASPKFLLDLALLFNFAMDAFNPFILVLAGLPFLLSRLELNQTQSLAQRLVVRFQMEPLNREEVNAYLEHHLSLVGATRPLFEPPAVEAIASRSRGWPRLVNNLALTSLLWGAQLKAQIINADIVRQAATEIGL